MQIIRVLKVLSIVQHKTHYIRYALVLDIVYIKRYNGSKQLLEHQ